MCNNIKNDFLISPLTVIAACLFVSMFALNNVVTFDSHLYYKLSQKVTSGWGDWDMVRTPIFPALLAITEKILGKGAQTFVFLNTLFLFFGCYLVADILKAHQVRRRYVFLALSAFISPVIITYQHTFLSESGLSLVLIVIVWVALREFSTANWRYLTLGLVMVVAYYYKPHFKYFALLIFLLVYIAQDLQFSIRKPQHGWLHSLKSPAMGMVLFAMLIYPWDRVLQHSARLEVLNYFPLAMGVVPPEERHLGGYLRTYSKAIESSSGIPRGGIPGELVYPLLGAPDKHLLKAAIIENPFGYLKAVFRTFSNYIWSPKSGSENRVFFNGVAGVEVDLTRTKIYYVPESMSELRDAVTKRFDSAYKPGVLANLLVMASPTLNLVVAIFICLLPVVFIRGVITKNVLAFVSSGAALGYLGMHSMALMCIDRYAAPTIPLVFFAVVTAFFVSSQDALKDVNNG